MKKTITTFLLLAVTGIFLFAQSPKREMRATWLATVSRLDWPSTTVPAATGNNETARQTAINTQKNGLISMLNTLQSENINAVFFQVRPMCDAFYKSSYEPWSQYISSTRGADPGWDPLAFAIEECHKRGMELHAWINPYRYSQNSSNHGNLSTDYAVARPGWLLDYGSSVKILNPGVPEVVQQISDIVAEIVTNYSLDGIVFDDYFYVNGTTNGMDQTQFNAYNPNGLARDDWRRANVNKMVKTVYERIRSIKPYVIFGVSPAGVAKSGAAAVGISAAGACGSDWQYNQICSDPLAWLYEGSLDYISPQIYWRVGHSSNDYDCLSKWWSETAAYFGRYFYSSHSFASGGGAEMGLQINCNRNYDSNGAPGSVFFRTNASSTDPGLTTSSVVSYLNTNHFQYKAIPPAVSWKPAPEQSVVTNLALSGQNLTWTYGEDVRYVVYAGPKSATDSQLFASSLYMLGISYAKQYTLPSGIGSATHRIAVSILDRYGNEYAPRVLGESATTPKATNLISPIDNASVGMSALFTWESVSGAAGYVWQVARDAAFNDVISSRETAEPKFTGGLPTSLKDKTTYYWRVKTLTVNGGTVWSAARRFNTKTLATISKVETKTDLHGNIDLRYSMNITFSHKMNKALVEAAVSILPAENISLSWAGDYILNINLSQLQFETAYTLKIDGSVAKDSEMNNFLDGAGNGVEGSVFTLNFTTCEADKEYPVVVSYDPQGSREETARPIVRIEFNKLLKESSIAPNQIIVKDKNGNAVDGEQSYYAAANNKSVMHYLFRQDLNPQEPYTVTLAAGLEDLFGNVNPVGFTFTFTARPRDVSSTSMLEAFTSLEPGEWSNATQLTGLNTAASSAVIDEDVRATVGSPGSLRFIYQWQGSVTSGEWRFHAYAASSTLSSFTKNTDSYLQFYLFGDGSGTRFSPVLQRVSGTTTYYSKPIVMDWVGWRLITWNLNETTGLFYPWLGGSGAIPSEPVCVKSLHTQTAQPLDNRSGTFWLSQVQVVRLGDYISVGTDKISAESDISIFPVGDYIQVSSSSIIKTIKIYSITGALIKTIQPGQTSYPILTYDLTPGIYIVRAVTETAQKNAKVSVQ